jgi:hypothetical protein
MQTNLKVMVMVNSKVKFVSTLFMADHFESNFSFECGSKLPFLYIDTLWLKGIKL